MTDPDNGPPGTRHDPATTEDLRVATEWLGQYIAALRQDIDTLGTDSAGITAQIIGDLAGLRADMIALQEQLPTPASLADAVHQELLRAARARARRGRRTTLALLTFLLVLALLAVAIWFAP